MTKRNILTRALALMALMVVVGALLVLQTFYHQSPQTGPSVELVTTRCVRPNGQPVGEGYGQPCPSGTTPDTVVIQSLLPTIQP